MVSQRCHAQRPHAIRSAHQRSARALRAVAADPGARRRCSARQPGLVGHRAAGLDARPRLGAHARSRRDDGPGSDRAALEAGRGLSPARVRADARLDRRTRPRAAADPGVVSIEIDGQPLTSCRSAGICRIRALDRSARGPADRFDAVRAPQRSRLAGAVRPPGAARRARAIRRGARWRPHVRVCRRLARARGRSGHRPPVALDSARSTLEIKDWRPVTTLVIEGESPLRYFDHSPTIIVRAGDRGDQPLLAGHRLSPGRLHLRRCPPGLGRPADHRNGPDVLPRRASPERGSEKVRTQTNSRRDPIVRPQAKGPRPQADSHRCVAVAWALGPDA